MSNKRTLWALTLMIVLYLCGVAIGYGLPRPSSPVIVRIVADGKALIIEDTYIDMIQKLEVYNYGASVDVVIHSKAKCAISIGGVDIWFRHTAARDTFHARLMANKDLYRLFGIPSSKTSESVGL